MINFYTKDLIQTEFKNSVGEFTYGHPEISGHGGENISIGKFCSIAGGVKIILGGGHDYHKFTSYPFSNIYDMQGDGHKEWVTAPDPILTGHENYKVVIGHDVWIGCRVTILSGVTIGNGAVIGAGAVVSKDIPPYAVAVGNPIHLIKYRFTPVQIEALEKIQWWNFPIDKLRQALTLLNSDIDTFIAAYI